MILENGTIRTLDPSLPLARSLAIAGVPPLNGFASEWLTLQALVHVPAYGGLGDGLAGALALAALAATAALAVFCFVKVVGLVLLGPPRRAAVADATEAPVPVRAAVVALAGACVALGVVPGLLVAPLAHLAPWPVSVHATLALHLPGTGSLPTVGIALALGLLAPLLFFGGLFTGIPRDGWRWVAAQVDPFSYLDSAFISGLGGVAAFDGRSVVLAASLTGAVSGFVIIGLGRIVLRRR